MDVVGLLLSVLMVLVITGLMVLIAISVRGTARTLGLAGFALLLLVQLVWFPYTYVVLTAVRTRHLPVGVISMTYSLLTRLLTGTGFALLAGAILAATRAGTRGPGSTRPGPGTWQPPTPTA